MADFEFYALNYKGTAIPDETAFNSVLTEATAVVEAHIGCRDNLAIGKVQTAYNNAICAVAEIVYDEKNVNKNGLQSETVGNHSKTYANKTDEERNNAKSDKVKLYLRNTGLLYRGIGYV